MQATYLIGKLLFDLIVWLALFVEERYIDGMIMWKELPI